MILVLARMTRSTDVFTMFNLKSKTSEDRTTDTAVRKPKSFVQFFITL